MLALKHTLQQSYNKHDGNCPEERQAHVFLGIPNIALCAEVGGALLREEEVGYAPFDEFVQPAEAEGDFYGEHPANPFIPAETIAKQVAHGVGEEKAEVEMHNAVVVVAGHLEGVLQPVAEGVFGIGVLGAIYVQHEVDKHEGVAEVAEAELFIGDGNEQQEAEGKGIFDEPVLYVGGSDEGR